MSSRRFIARQRMMVEFKATSRMMLRVKTKFGEENQDA